MIKQAAIIKVTHGYLVKQPWKFNITQKNLITFVLTEVTQLIVAFEIPYICHLGQIAACQERKSSHYQPNITNFTSNEVKSHD